MTDSVAIAPAPAETRLPIAHLPGPVLPGAVVTLALTTDELRRAVDAAVDGRLVLTGADERAIGVVARVPDTGSLPDGDPAAIVQVEARARVLAVHPGDRGASFADVEVLRDPRPTPRVEAAAREMRTVLEMIAELRRSRRLPELLRRGLDPGELADGVAIWPGRLIHLSR